MINLIYENDEKNGVLKRSIVANTYLLMDSHLDVHMPGIFSKTIVERKDRIAHLHDHKFEISAKVGRPISFKEVKVMWRDLGLNIPGETYSLIVDTKIEKGLNEMVYNEYLSDAINQHSVAMEYVRIEPAINDEAYPDAFKAWKEVYPMLGNPHKADEMGFFWVVREAKLIEVSAVLIGSNELTPTLGSKNYKLLNMISEGYAKGMQRHSSDRKKILTVGEIKELFKKHYKL